MIKKIPLQVTRAFNNSQGWRNVGGMDIYFRSKWEANYSRYLQWQKENGYILEWKHEPYTFWFENIKRGVRSYLPDFSIMRVDSKIEWVEVKGYYDAKTKTKIKRMKKYYPAETLTLIDAKWFSNNNCAFRLLIKEWE